MNDSIRQQETGTQPPNSLLVGLQMVNSIIKWLASLVAPTEEDQEDAGVYLGGEGRD